MTLSVALPLQWPSALKPVWELLTAAHSGEAADWDNIKRWLLIPCRGGAKRTLVRVAQRALVFCPSYESYLEPAAPSTAAPRSFPVAMENTASTELSGAAAEPSTAGQGSASGEAAAEGAASPEASSLASDLASAQAPEQPSESVSEQQSSERASTDQVTGQPEQTGSSETAGQESSAPAQDGQPGQSAEEQHAEAQGYASSEAQPAPSSSAAESIGSATTGQSTSAGQDSSTVQAVAASSSTAAAGTQTASAEQAQRAENGSTAAAESAPEQAAPVPAQAQSKQRLAKPWDRLVPFLREQSLPILDKGFARLAPVCALQHSPSEQDAFVHKFLLCHRAGLFDVRAHPSYGA